MAGSQKISPSWAPVVDEAPRLTRRGFLAAAGALGALGLAGCAPKDVSTPADQDTVENNDYDVVIVGAGGAGLSAAIATHDAGVENVVVLEKMGVNGGNTNYSSSGMNASETKFQKEQGIDDSTDLFIQETLDGGHNTGDEELVTFMCENSAEAIDWLDGLGITLDNIGQTGGMSVKRCHRPTDGSAVGTTLVPGLVAAAEERGIPIRNLCEVTELVTNDGAVVGVVADDNNTPTVYNAKAVILAAGGLGSNPEMIAQYRPDLKDFVSTNQPGATGDGYRLAEDVGAELVQMDQIQIHPTVEQTTHSLVAEGIRGSGAILVNVEGKRFFDEMSTRDKVSAAELAQPNGDVWCVFDQQVYDANKSVAKLEKQGLVTKADSVAALAEAIGVDAAALEATVAAYNAVAGGAADEFGRTQGCIVFADGPMYAIKVAPGIHHEMGGIKINVNNEALDADGNAIPGLYAAGEVTGGIHGNNRIGGNAVCDIEVFGKNVGEVVASRVVA